MSEDNICPICDKPVIESYTHDGFTFFIHEKNGKKASIWCRVPNAMLDPNTKPIINGAVRKAVVVTNSKFKRLLNDQMDD